MRPLILSWCFLLCTPFFTLAAQEEASPEAVFEEFWAIYHDGYALFGVKNIDWDAVYEIYRPRIHNEMSGDELFAVLTDMAGLMNDIHVVIRDREGDRFYRSGARSIATGEFDIGEVSLELIAEAYTQDGLTALAEGNFRYGWLDDGVGYFHFGKFQDIEASTAAIDEVIAEFGGAKAVIIDVRQNGGGNDKVGQAILNRFADRKRLYMTVRNRNIMEPRDSFAERVEWYLEPAGPAQFTGPVILLTNSRSISAAENFAMAMSVLPRAAIVGEATAGVFADAGTVPLPNGWEIGVPINIFRDANGICWEGIGIQPDYWVANTVEEIEAGTDRQLDYALALTGTDSFLSGDGPLQPPRVLP